MKVKLFILSISISIVALLTSACGSSEGSSSGLFQSHISGPTASGWYPLSVLLSDIWMDEIEGMNMTVVEGGAIGNIRDVNSGRDVQSGIAFASDFADARQGIGAFEDDKQENVMAIGTLYPNWWNFAVLDNSSIETLEDFIEQGGHLAPGQHGDASAQTAQRVFRAMGYEFEDLEESGSRVTFENYGDALNQLRDGLIDMVVQGGAPNATGLSEIDSTRPVRLISIPDDVLQKLDEEDYGYTIDMDLPANTYKNQTEDISTVVTMALLIVNKDMDEEVVYEMTKSLWENLDRINEEQPTRGKWFDPEVGYSEVYDPENTLHPGALRYYQEIGVAE
ncbi:TAXI family TRAP transporter solute-binding subunit [Desertibacillus haloalkaliphilus]|uniref:TAXI family TRAP transporter solute-binding subunit n=1 Tax=Desertibacillus haloalkaliphilus TaxID=1328930 RepID=UPI001C2794DD|nr:TAXI family TRAP transporter solute-binding subunit [Desertibacillus haloalkaliphilus]MBU8906096.1 TAXI family TRAP transporter solute-binding subunit [Desertibacillus haloalkaliphilus]